MYLIEIRNFKECDVERMHIRTGECLLSCFNYTVYNFGYNDNKMYFPKSAGVCYIFKNSNFDILVPKFNSKCSSSRLYQPWLDSTIIKNVKL